VGDATFNPDHADVWRHFADALRPPPELLPSEFTRQYRITHEVYCTERPGRWDDTVFPWQAASIDVVAEAIRTGKRGVVVLKAGQIGGTEWATNGQMWLKEYYPGPQLFLTSTDDVAREFGRERFDLIIGDMPPLARRFRPNPRGDILVKRFTDGKILLAGGQSVFKLQSTPYRVVVIDELDSLVASLHGEGDPLKLAMIRTDSFTGPTLIIAYAHPTTRQRGAAKLYYESSDQRRGFVKHAKEMGGCDHEFYLQWDHVKCTGQDRDPEAYVYACPGCGEVIDDAHRVRMVRQVVYRSTLPAAEAAKKSWIGIHASQLYSPGKSLRSIAEDWIACDCGREENGARVFWNKKMGEPYEPKLTKLDVSSFRQLIVVKRRPDDPDFYSKGQVPAGVRFLTGGQDSRATQFHWAIWGWGLRRDISGTAHLCGWLIDWGTLARQYSLIFSEAEYHVFDELIYRKVFPAAIGDKSFQVRMCAHDIGYAPTQVPIVEYCAHFPERAVPAKGASLTATSACQAPYARWGNPIKYRLGDQELEGPRSLIINTYMIKNDFYGMAQPTRKIEVPDPITGTRKINCLAFPEDVDDDFLKQSASEELRPGEREGELVWKHTGPNHQADCNAQAQAAARIINPFQLDETAEEYEQRKGRGDARTNRPRPGGAGREREGGAVGRNRNDPSMG
jgi:phage terminase large subunit GpA-like protein